jgi:hypothetical protein
LRGGFAGYLERVSGFARVNLNDVENQAPAFGVHEEPDAPFARRALGGETFGPSSMKPMPSFRTPFGHTDVGQEGVHVVVRGSGRIKLARTSARGGRCQN